MLDAQILKLFKTKLFFMGTVEGTIPHVCPMEPYIVEQRSSSD